MERTRRLASVLVASLLAGLVALPGALAGGFTRLDGNDTRGPLDLARVRVSHATPTADAIAIRTIASFSNAQIDGSKGNFVIPFSRDGGEHFQWVAYVFYADGALRGILIDKFGNIAARLPVRRTSGRSIVVKIRREELANLSYRFAVGSVWRRTPCSARRPCVDLVPNRGTLLHDVVDPTARLTRLPLLQSTDFTATEDGAVQAPVSLRVRDDRFGSGIRIWKVQRREPDGTWSTQDTGSALEATAQVTGEQGRRYRFRVLAVDRQGNSGVSEVRFVTIPIDDVSTSTSYEGNWTPATSPDWYLGTGMLGAYEARVSVTFTGREACLLLRPTSGATATVEYLVSGETAPNRYGGTFTLTGATTPVCALVLSDVRDSWTFNLTVTSGEAFIFDGVAVW